MLKNSHGFRGISTDSGDRLAVSVHVYGPALSEMTAYECFGEHLPPVDVRRIGDDW